MPPAAIHGRLSGIQEPIVFQVLRFTPMPRPRDDEEYPFPPPRLIELHGVFDPESDARDNLDSLRDVWFEARAEIDKDRERSLKRRKREWKQLQDAITKLTPLIQSVLEGKGPPLGDSTEAEKLVPSKELRRKVVDWYADLIMRSTEDPDPNAPSIEEQEEACARADRALKCTRNASNALSELSDIAAEDFEAANALWELAEFTTGLVLILAKKHPDRFRKVAATKGMMPVLAKHDEAWVEDAQERIALLKLGSALPKILTPLRQAQGADETRASRRWAQAAVAAIDETRWRVQFFNALVKELGGRDAWGAFAVKNGWDRAALPSWGSDAVRLPPLSSESAEAWKKVIRSLVREQMPDFHTLPEWENQRLRCAASGRNTPGVIRNAILDDIVRAFGPLVP